jgi:hypothetical protein
MFGTSRAIIGFNSKKYDITDYGEVGWELAILSLKLPYLPRFER